MNNIAPHHCKKKKKVTNYNLIQSIEQFEVMDVSGLNLPLSVNPLGGLGQTMHSIVYTHYSYLEFDLSYHCHKCILV